jgi:acetyl esterase/lipase
MQNPIDLSTLLDAETAAALAALPAPPEALSTENLARIRAARAAAPTIPVSDRVTRVDHRVAERAHVTVRVHREKNANGNLPCIYWMHGGGLVLGSHLGDDPRFDQWCPDLGCVGVSVEYALAPESQYPGPLEDCYAGLKWLHTNAQELGVDVNRIGIGGSSAGAGLAAGLALLARDRAELPIAFQALIYPMIDDRQITTSSQWPDPVWPPQSNRFGWDSYLGDLTGEAIPIYAAAARATDLQDLPPTFICVGAIDGFADEDIDYATRLRHAGVACELHVYPGAPHGFDSLTPNTRLAQRAKRELEDWLSTQLIDN